MADNLLNIDRQNSTNQVNNIAEQIQVKAQTSPEISTGDFYSDIRGLISKPTRLSTGFTDYTISDTHKQMSDNTYVPKYEDFDVTVADNNELYAQQQKNSEKWSNGLLKFLGKTGTAIIGGTVGTVAGAFEMMKTGNLESLYDNEFSKRLNDLNEKMDYKLPNYYTQEERDEGIISSMGNANFWANDFLGGLSFTVGAIGSEAIWGLATGGGSLATIGARYGTKLGAKSYAKTLSKSFFKDVVKEGGEVILDKSIKTGLASTLGRAGALTNTARFMYTSAGYEASVESMSYMNEMRNNFKQDFLDKNGQEPTEEDFYKFNTDLVDGANTVFALNVALVGSSNLATFGKVLNIERPKLGVSNFTNKKLFGVGLDKTGKDVLKATRAQKIAGSLYSFMKPAVVEGVFEEGGQGVVSKAMESYVSSMYDPKYATGSMDIVEAFAEGFDDTFTTKDGWKEVWLGMLIGVVGGKGADLASGNFQGDLAQARKNAENLAGFNRNYSGAELAQNIFFANRVQASSENQDFFQNSGDNVSEELARKQGIVAQLSYAYNLEHYNDVVDDTVTAIRNTSVEDISRDLNITEEEANAYKQEVEEDYTNTARSFKKNRDFAEYYFGDNIKNKTAVETEMIKDTVAFILTAGEGTFNISNNLLESIKEDLAGIVGAPIALDINQTISLASLETQNEYDRLIKELSSAQKELIEVQDKISRPNIVAEESEAKALAEEANSLAYRLSTLQETVTDTTSKLNILINTAKIENPYNTDNSVSFISDSDLLNTQEILGEIEKYVDFINKQSPQKGEEFNNKLKAYKEYSRALKEFGEVNRALASGDLNMSSNKSLFGRIFGNKNLQDKEKQFIDSIAQRLGDNWEGYIEQAWNLNRITKDVKDSIEANEDIAKQTQEQSIIAKTSLEMLIEQSPYLSGRFNAEALQEAYENQAFIDEMNDLILKANGDANFSGLVSDIENNTILDDAEKQRLSELMSTLGVINIGEGFENEGVTLTEILMQNNQLKLGDSLSENENSDKIVSDDFVDMLSEEELLSPSGKRQEDITQTAENVQISFRGSEVNFHNLKLNGLLSKLNFDKVTLVADNRRTNPSLTEIPDVSGTVVKLDFPSGDILNVEVTDRGSLKISSFSKDVAKTTLNIIEENSDLRSVKYSHGRGNRYSFLYENGKMVDSDFEITPRYNYEAIYDLNRGDVVKFEVDENDPFNQTLLDKPIDEITRLVKIYVVDTKGNVVGELKSQDGTYGTDAFNLLRDSAASILKDGGGLLDYETTVSRIFLGAPNLTLNENGIPQAVNFSDENIIDYGYYENGRLNLKNGTEPSTVNSDFINKLKNKNRAPVVIFRRGSQVVAMPVMVTGVDSNSGETYRQAFENDNSGTARKVINFNRELISRGYSNLFYYNSPSDQNIYKEDGSLNDETLEAVNFLNKYQTLPNLLEMTKEALSENIQSAVDFGDRPIASPKIRLDFNNMYKVQNQPIITSETIEIPQELIIEESSTETEDIVERVLGKKPEGKTSRGTQKSSKSEPVELLVTENPSGENVKIEKLPFGITMKLSTGYVNYTIPAYTENVDRNNEMYDYLYEELLEEGDFLYPNNSPEFLEYKKGQVLNKETKSPSKIFKGNKPDFKNGVVVSKKATGSRKSKVKEDIITVDESLEKKSKQEQDKKC